MAIADATLVLIIVAALAAGWIALEAVLAFQGTCGGLVPFLAQAQPCTLPQAVWAQLTFTAAVVLSEFGGWVLLATAMVFGLSAACRLRRK